MGNPLLAHSNRIDSSVVNDGAWLASLPLTNLQDRVYAKVARTTDRQLSSTKFKVDLQSAKLIRLIGFLNHNLSLDARYRITASATSDFAVLLYDSGWADVWPVVYPFGTVEWDADNFWSGQYSAEEIEGTKPHRGVILPTPIYARFWRIEFNDTLNPDGYVQLGRLFIGPAWQPSRGMSLGASLNIETETDVQRARSGTEYFGRRPSQRVQNFTIAQIDFDEGYGIAFEILRRMGIDGEVFFVADPNDTAHALRRQFPARIRQQSGVENPWPIAVSVGFQVSEIL